MPSLVAFSAPARLAMVAIVVVSLLELVDALVDEHTHLHARRAGQPAIPLNANPAITHTRPNQGVLQPRVVTVAVAVRVLPSTQRQSVQMTGWS